MSDVIFEIVEVENQTVNRNHHRNKKDDLENLDDVLTFLDSICLKSLPQMKLLRSDSKAHSKEELCTEKDMQKSQCTTEPSI